MDLVGASVNIYGKIPHGWMAKPLGTVVENYDRYRKPLSKRQRSSRPGPFPYYGAAKIFDYIDDYIFDGEYCLIAEDGSVVTEEGHPVMQLARGKFWANNHTHILKGRLVSTRYLYYYLSGFNIHGYVTGAAQPKINQSNLNRIPVLIPPRHLEERIVSVLGAYDDLIENNARRIEILEEMARAVYREWFVEHRFPGHEDVELVDSELGPITEGWEVAPLSELVSTQYGYTESATDEPVGPRFLRGTDINKQPYVDWDSVPFCSIGEQDFEKYRLVPGDIVVIRMADPGKPAIVEDEVDAVFASYLIRLKIVNEGVTPYYLFYYLQSPEYQGYVTGAATGTTRKSASAKVVTGVSLAIPPRELVRHFDSLVGPHRDLLNNLLRQNAALRASRDLLLPKLISGEIDVSDLDIDVADTA